MPDMPDFGFADRLAKNLLEEIRQQEESLGQAKRSIDETIAPLLAEFVKVYNSGRWNAPELLYQKRNDGRILLAFGQRTIEEREYHGPSFSVKAMRATPDGQDQVSVNRSSEWISVSDANPKEEAELIKLDVAPKRVLELCRDWTKATILGWLDCCETSEEV